MAEESEIEWDASDGVLVATVYDNLDNEIVLRADSCGFELSAGTFSMQLEANDVDEAKTLAVGFVPIVETVNELARKALGEDECEELTEDERTELARLRSWANSYSDVRAYVNACKERDELAIENKTLRDRLECADIESRNVDSAHKRTIRAVERRVTDAFEAGRAAERFAWLELARAHYYGPTLRTFAKWIARSKHEEAQDRRIAELAKVAEAAERVVQAARSVGVRVHGEIALYKALADYDAATKPPSAPEEWGPPVKECDQCGFKVGAQWVQAICPKHFSCVSCDGKLVAIAETEKVSP